MVAIRRKSNGRYMGKYSRRTQLYPAVATIAEAKKYKTIARAKSALEQMGYLWLERLEFVEVNQPKDAL